jgi:hypothetical protein
VSLGLWLLAAPSLWYFQSPVASHNSRALGLAVVALSVWALSTGPRTRPPGGPGQGRAAAGPARSTRHDRGAGRLRPRAGPSRPGSQRTRRDPQGPGQLPSQHAAAAAWSGHRRRLVRPVPSTERAGPTGVACHGCRRPGPSAPG